MTNQKLERSIMCPQCSAPLTPHRFGLSTVCPYCGATVQLDDALVSAERFHEAFRIWNSPKTYQIPAWISIGDRHWAVSHRIAQGDISDVYRGGRARFPTELTILKILRDRKDIAQFDNEWDAIEALHNSNALGADIFTKHIPQPVFHGDISAGSFAGKRINIFRWTSGFHHTLAEVMQAYPQGIPPRASIWIWRRILEVLSFIHASGMVHGAVLPSHLLAQENEHGILLVGYSVAGQIGEKLRSISKNSASFYPKFANFRLKLTKELDLSMSAKSIVAVLGGEPESASLPTAVPSPLAEIIQRIALSKTRSEDAWSIREELGTIAKEVFGTPQFIPIVMPD